MQKQVFYDEIYSLHSSLIMILHQLPFRPDFAPVSSSTDCVELMKIGTVQIVYHSRLINLIVGEYKGLVALQYT